MTDSDPQQMQPHELEHELGLTTGSTGPHEWKWMRFCVQLQRALCAAVDRITRLEAVNKRQLDYHRNPTSRPTNG